MPHTENQTLISRDNRMNIFLPTMQYSDEFWGLRSTLEYILPFLHTIIAVNANIMHKIQSL